MFKKVILVLLFIFGIINWVLIIYGINNEDYQTLFIEEIILNLVLLIMFFYAIYYMTRSSFKKSDIIISSIYYLPFIIMQNIYTFQKYNEFLNTNNYYYLRLKNIESFKILEIICGFIPLLIFLSCNKKKFKTIKY